MKTLDKTERQVLLRKNMNNGLDFQEALDKVNEFHDYLKSMRNRLKIAGKSDKEVNEKFRQEFEKMICKLDV